MLRTQALPGPQGQRALRNILAGRAHIGPGPQACRQDHAPVGIVLHILLHEDGVGTLGHRRAGENAHDSVGRDRSGGRSGLHAARDGKGARGIMRQVGAAERIAVDGGIGKQRQRQWRVQRMGQHAIVGIMQGDALDASNGRDARSDQRDGLVDGHERTAEGKAIIRELRHGQAPALSAAIRSATVTALASIISATAAMSSSAKTGSDAAVGASVTSATMALSCTCRNGLPLAMR